MAPSAGAVVTPDRFDAVLCDLDGVLTDTASLHAAAWRATFDPYLAGCTPPQRPFSDDDYLAFVDGKPREAGVRSLLRSRGLPAPGSLVAELAGAKQARFDSALTAGGVDVFDDGVGFVRACRAAGLGVAVVSSSRNASAVLGAAGLAGLVDVVVDGNDVAGGLAGKPAPDTFLAACHRLGVAAGRTVVVEDAESGVAAGRVGRFGLVVGVDRVGGGHGAALAAAGADVVVADLGVLRVGADVGDGAGVDVGDGGAPG